MNSSSQQGYAGQQGSARAARLRGVSSFQTAGLPEHGTGEWSRHSDSNRGPAVYELDRPKRCGTSVKPRA
jgi:hypothetical protein